MINLQFNFVNPWSDRWHIIRSWYGQTWINYKCWELQLNATNSVIGGELRFTVRQDHAGLYFSVSLLGYEAIVNFYDSRHWDYQRAEWTT